MNRLQFLILFFVVVLIGGYGCGNADYQRTKDGLIYRIISDGKGVPVKPGMYLKLHQKVMIGDSVLFSSFEGIPSYGLFDSVQVVAHDFVDIMDKMRIGDSAIVVRSVDTLYKKGLLQYSDLLKKGGNIRVHVRMLSSFKDEAAMNADKEKVTDDYKVFEQKRLKAYVASLKLSNAQEIGNGVWLAISKEGTGIKADSGKTVAIRYAGKLKNGTVFDANNNPGDTLAQPLIVQVGAREIIEGLERAFPYLNKGARATVFIPSMQGYGPSPSGGKIPAYSDLIFDIEVLSVTEKTPVTASVQAMQEQVQPRNPVNADSLNGPHNH